MTTSVGTLQVELLASIGKFTESIDAARKQAESAFSGMEKAASVAKGALGFLGVGLSVGAFVGSIRSAIDSLDQLNDLSLRTGASVESLSAFRTVAKLSNTDMELLGTSIQKLSKAMDGTEEQGGKAGATFQRLGIAVKDSTGQLRPSEEVLVDVAKKLDGMESATQRVAFAQQIFGKAGANLLPFLHELAQTGELNAKVTKEQAEAADKFNDNLVKLQGGANKLKVAIANELLPSLNDITDRMVLAKQQGGGMFDSMIEGAKAAFQAVMRLNNAGDLNKISEEMVKKSELILSLERRQDRNPDAFTANRIKLLRDEFSELVKKRDVMEGIVALEQPGAITGQVKKKTFVGDVPKQDGVADRIKQEQQALQALQEQLGGVGKEMTEFDRVMQRVTTGTWKDFGDEAKVALLSVAGEIDLAKGRLEAFKNELEGMKAEREVMDEANRQGEQFQLREKARIEQLQAKYIELIDPIEKYRKMLEEIDALEERGNLNATQALEARARVQDQIDETLTRNIDKTKDADGLAKQLGLTFSSAFEEAVIKGGKLSDVIRGLGQDIARIVARRTITNPLADAVGDSIKGVSFGSIGKLLGFATGGSFEVGGAGGTDSQVVAFRATPGEQVSITPPGGGGGAGGQVVVNVNLTAGVNATVRAEVAALVPSIAQAAAGAVLDAKRRGGSFARGLA